MGSSIGIPCPLIRMTDGSGAMRCGFMTEPEKLLPRMTDEYGAGAVREAVGLLLGSGSGCDSVRDEAAGAEREAERAERRRVAGLANAAIERSGKSHMISALLTAADTEGAEQIADFREFLDKEALRSVAHVLLSMIGGGDNDDV